MGSYFLGLIIEKTILDDAVAFVFAFFYTVQLTVEFKFLNYIQCELQILCANIYIFKISNRNNRNA